MRDDPLQTGQSLFWTRGDETLQVRPLPGIVLPVLLIKVANVAFVYRTLRSLGGLDALHRGLHFRLLCLGFLLLASLFPHGGDGVDGPRDVADGGRVPRLGGVSQPDVFRVVEVFGEGLGDGVELVFDHDVDVVG